MTDFLGLFRNAPDAQAYAAGAVVFEAGDPAACMYVVRRGEVEIRLRGQTVETVREGGLVGEIALVDDGPRSATVVAAADSELIPIDRRRFLFLVERTPYFALEVMRTMAARLRR
jgi:CRP-like cAMP-binding protein